MSTAVKRIHESMRGAPTLNGTAGSLVAVLDAFLVNGWGMVTALSASVSAGVCTITFSAGDTFEADAVVLVAGATPAGLNGQHRVTSVTATTLTFDTAEADGAATGTITVKYAPAGWQKAYSGSNKAVYRSQNVTGARRYLRVLDSATTYARVIGYNAMTTVDSGTGPFPTNAQQSGGLYWPKADTAGATAQRYDVIADDMQLFYAPAIYYVASGSPTDANASVQIWGFGDPVPLKPAGDVWGTWITGQTSNNWADANGALATGNEAGMYVERVIAGTGSAIASPVRPHGYGAGYPSGALQNSAGNLPNAVNGRVFLQQMKTCLSDTDYTPRAIVPGLYLNPQGAITTAGMFQSRDTVPGPGSMSGRKFLFHWLGAYSASGGAFIDITGPWR